MKWFQVFIVSLAFVYSANGWAQSYSPAYTFINYQKSFPRISLAADRVEDSLMKQFQQRNWTWPAKYIYIRSFKYDSQLEVWIKQEKNEKFQLFKTYKVCALSGSLGPKRMQGDYQVPEGFYYINQFNPNSNYHLSLGLNYPNLSDRVLSDSIQPGGDIFIHGSCVTTGCIPIRDSQIEELYILASHARTEGQDFIPVHIFPIRYDNPKSSEQLIKFLRQYPEYTSLNKEMRKAFNFFEENHQLPLIMVNRKGHYIIEATVPLESASNSKDPSGTILSMPSEPGSRK